MFDVAEHRDEILKRWMDRVIDSYPEETAKFLRSKADPFANPVGAGLREGLAELLDGVIDGFVDGVEFVLAGDAFGDELGAQIVDRAFLFPFIHFFFRAIRIKIAFIMTAPSIGLAFDERRPFSRAGPFDSLIDGGLDGHHIIAVDYH